MLFVVILIFLLLYSLAVVLLPKLFDLYGLLCDIESFFFSNYKLVQHEIKTLELTIKILEEKLVNARLKEKELQGTEDLEIERPSDLKILFYLLFTFIVAFDSSFFFASSVEMFYNKRKYVILYDYA